MIAALTAGIAACAPPGTSFSTTITTTAGDLPLKVSLRDESGQATGIAGADVDTTRFRSAGIEADPADPDAFILTWLGGMCDNDVELVLRSTNPGYDVHMTEHEKLGLGCPAAGVLRAVRIATREPLAIDQITVSGSKTLEFIVERDCGPLEVAATGDAKIACSAILEATVGGEAAGFATVTVRPEDGACPGADCSTAAAIAAQPWRVDATDRTGNSFAWRCSYAAEKASCTTIAAPSRT